MNEQLNIRLPPSVASLLSAAQTRYGAAVPRTRLVEIALGHGLRAIVANPALLFEPLAAPTEVAPAVAPAVPPTEAPAAPAAHRTEAQAPAATPRARAPRNRKPAAAPAAAAAAPTEAPTEAPPFDLLTPREVLEPAVYKAALAHAEKLKKQGHPTPLRAVLEGSGVARSSYLEWRKAAERGQFNQRHLGLGKLRDLARFLGVIQAPDASTPDASTP